MVRSSGGQSLLWIEVVRLICITQVSEYLQNALDLRILGFFLMFANGQEQRNSSSLIPIFLANSGGYETIIFEGNINLVGHKHDVKNPQNRITKLLRDE
jgi:hypothetical protein